jgi:hypothetical protein
MNYLHSPLEIDKANTTPSAYWASAYACLILSADLLPNRYRGLSSELMVHWPRQYAKAVTIFGQLRLLRAATL